MVNLNLLPSDPYTLTISSDSRISHSDYFDDQIWKLNLQDADTQALTIYSTLGLRAKSLRIFPRFTENNFSIINPLNFITAPVIRKIYPNYIQIQFSPFDNIDVIAEYWVPDSHGLAGRFSITNKSKKTRNLNLELIEQLAPINGKVVAPTEIESTTVLSGSTSNVETVLYLTKGAEPGKGSFPSLKVELSLAPKQQERIIWVHAALQNQEASFSFAREIVNTRWDAKISHIELLNRGNIEIHTGEKSWDIAFMLSQKVANQLLINPTTNLPFMSFIVNREPDQGYSFSHDGQDYSELWRGQTPLATYYIAQILQLTSPDLITGFLKNFFSTQNENGFIELKPGLGGQKTGILATPILSHLTLEIYRTTQDKPIIKEAFPHLLKFINYWFSHKNDRDKDGIPEWSHPIQINLDYHPAFSNQKTSSNISKIHFIEPVSLSSLLYNECSALIQMAQILNQEEHIEKLLVYQKKLESFIESSWDDHSAIYRDRDRSSHIISKKIFIGRKTGTGILIVNKNITPPGRLMITIQRNSKTIREPQIYIHGVNTSNSFRIEKLSLSDISWNINTGQAISEIVYKKIDHITFHNIDKKDEVTITTVDLNYLDITQLLPLWANISDKIKADQIVKHTITNRSMFWKKNGLATCIIKKQEDENSACWQSHLPYTTMIANGLLNYGYRKEAADLFSKIMYSIIKSLSDKKSFYKNYNVLNGNGKGEPNVLSGLVPINLFLKIIGIEFFSNSQISISGFNPFPWPVSIKFRGITVLKQENSTHITFPNGEELTFDDIRPRTIQY